MDDRHWMAVAVEQAKIAGSQGEVPIGAVIVQDGVQLVSVGYNLREQERNALAHAEVLAVNRACDTLGGWRLPRCTLYVTLEPCPMCAGAIINSRIDRVVFGAYDLKAGSCGSVVNLFDLPYNHKPELVGGVMEEECANLLRDFFRQLRQHNIKKQPSKEL